jgi:hypothetical protein
MAGMVTKLAKTMCDVLEFKSLASLLYILEAVTVCPTMVRQHIHSV